MDVKQQIINAFNFRFACKEFDANHKISNEEFNVILEAGRLSPSSFGFEPWKFVVLQNMELREKIRPYCWGAQKQLPTASHFIVLLARQGSELRPDSEYLRTIMEELQKSPSEIIQTRMTRVKSFEEEDFKLTDDRLLLEWACRQAYIPLANMMTTATMMKIDSCPIEGFNREQVEKILVENNIYDQKHFGIACMVAFGYRLHGPKREKTRQSRDIVVEWIK